MRTNIHIDDNLMSDAQRLSGAKTKKEAVEQGLKLLVQMHEQQSIKQLRGKLQWEGDLDQMRKGIDTTEPSA
ncbi:type II toxin-antitoxin system VapB family antitoxin [uncultured Psychrobacter sp.]|uniref:type II toxin-antitoxin system VapB family antitoxin n=1 Tax=uncultured Psychrobacter sp. TaxID=259303 RepID=UPI00345AD32D